MKTYRALALAISAAALLQGCGGEEKQVGVYALAPQDVLTRLENADIDGFRARRQCGILIHIARESTNDSVTWRVNSEGRPVARFTVRLTPEGQGTRTTIEVPEAPDGGEIYDGTKKHTRPALQQPLRPAVQELIDSAIEGRAFDVMRMPEPRNLDDICKLQKAGLQHGTTFGINDVGGKTKVQSDRIRADEKMRRESESERETRDFGKPMTHPGGQY